MKRRIAQTASDFETQIVDLSKLSALRACSQGIITEHAQIVPAASSSGDSFPLVPRYANLKRMSPSRYLMEPQSINRRTTMTSTAHTLDSLVVFQLGLWNSADAGRIEIRFFRLYAPEATQLQSLPPLMLHTEAPLEIRTFSYPCFFHLAIRFPSA